MKEEKRQWYQGRNDFRGNSPGDYQSDPFA